MNLKDNYNFSFKEIRDILENEHEQLNLWREIVGTSQLYEPVLSPFRSDSNLGNVYLDKYQGSIVLTDFSNRVFHNTNVIKALVILKGRQEAYNYIGCNSNSTYVSKKSGETINKKCYISFQPVPLYKQTLDYYATYGITQAQLEFDGIKNSPTIKLNKWDKKLGERTIVNLNLGFTQAIFTFPSGNCKVYQPLRTDKSKWLASNATKSDTFKIDYGNRELIVISSSHKDIRVAVNALNHQGSGIAPQSEGVPVKPENTFNSEAWEFIKSHERIIVAGDLDTAGKAFTESIGNYLNVEKFVYPENLPTVNSYGKKNKDLAELYRQGINLKELLDSH